MKTLRLLILLLLLAPNLMAAIEIDGNDVAFFNAVSKELNLMRSGHRGLVSQALIERLDGSNAPTVIRAVTSDEETWHPNDRKGSRSHIVPQDTKIQGAERRQPTGAVIYIHPSRIDPSLSLFKLGTFVYFLSMAADLNTGQFSSDYRLRERRAVFYSNAWKDSQKLPLLNVSDNVPTLDYQKAKDDGLLAEDQKSNFPIIAVTPLTAQ
jgi:hypothetical protein